MIELVKLTNYSKIKNIYAEAFPRYERLPLWILVLRSKSKYIECYGLFDDQILVGFTYIISKGDLSFIMYLAVDRAYRSKSYGSKCLDLIKNNYSGTIALNIEALDEASENYMQRQKRKTFYMKNAFSETGVYSKYGSLVNELLSYNGVVTYEDYLNIIKVFAGPIIGLFVSKYFSQKKAL